ncbi:HAD family hydrolase [Oricola cellulosilytica]|uniref:HAD family hydrolase n=1 Tax=Oricola cellulosilytica TaxID=1429082 RepID=A0A4R0PAA3_9HYPH|nr:HAD family hydrolase [Oricola cellulosilytica]TCD13172.1 HAD family hydrolase [Oricola cellulosilytica]
MKKNDIQLVIFDCDGVLIDSEAISARILIEQLAGVGIDVDAAYVQQNFLGRSWAKVASEVRSAHHLDLSSDFEERYRRELMTAFENELRSVDGVETVLNELAVSCCVATSSSPKRALRSLEMTGLLPYFGKRLFTASEVANGKPAPDLFLLAAASLGFQPQNCLVIEDSVPGVQAARAAGMHVYRFLGGSHLRGTAPPVRTMPADVVNFDNWRDFYEMAPQLRKTANVIAN